MKNLRISSIKAALDAVYNEMLDIIHNQLEITGSAENILPN
jgi:hypothetical protein